MATHAFDPPHFMHTDLDGDRIEVIESEHGSVVYAWGREGDHIAIAIHHEDIDLLIAVLTAIQKNQE